MKKGLLGSTALVGAAVLMAGAASAAEAPTWKLGGNVNFQVYVPTGDSEGFITTGGLTLPTSIATNVTAGFQDNSIYFGVDEAELRLNVSGSTDNGLDYGFKIELNANTTDGSAADEARISLGGSWGTLQLGDEDGAEDTMNYGGENLLGATGGWDGDGDDVFADFAGFFEPSMDGDTSDATKATYYSPRFSGLQVGGSFTPQPSLDGDDLKIDGLFENSFGLGVNYDGEFSGLRVRGSAVYGTAAAAAGAAPGIEDIAAFSVGGIVNFSQFAVAANYTDNGDSGTVVTPGVSFDDSYWNVAASFSQGPLGLAAGYISRTAEATGSPDLEFTSFALTADYSLAPGLAMYAEYTNYDFDAGPGVTLTTGAFIAGANVSF